MSEQRKRNRFWLELESPLVDGKIDHDLGRYRAESAGALLKVLYPSDYPHYAPVWWDEKRCMYAFTIDRAGSYVTASDNGHWFNLDYAFGQPMPQDVEA
jgi:hypothetical protein